MSSAARILGAVLGLCLVLGGLVVWWPSPSREAAPMGHGSARELPASGAVELAPLPEPSVVTVAPREAVAEASGAELAYVDARRGEGNALLRVSVVARANGAPLAGVRVQAEPTRAHVKHFRPVQSSRCGIDEAGVTDAQGRCELLVRSGESHRVRLVVQKMEVPPVLVPALVRRQWRALEIELPPKEDLVYHGVVVDAETGLPIAGARIGGDAQTDALGAFQLPARSWKAAIEPVEAVGYAGAYVGVGAGHETPATAFRVMLSRLASVEIAVSDSEGRPIPGVNVSLLGDAEDLLQTDWEADRYDGQGPLSKGRTDRDGSCIFYRVAPRIPLTLALRHGGGTSHPLAAPLVLEPGETRRLELRFGEGASLFGRTIDQHGRPVAGVGVNLRGGDFPWLVISSKTTDATGSFTFERIGAGHWLLSTAPSMPADAVGPAEAWAGVHAAVQVSEHEADLEVELRLDRGLFIVGRVLGTSGEPVVGKAVFARELDGLPVQYASPDSKTREDGSFAIGPLAAGRYAVDCLGKEHACRPVVARAGEGNLVLQLLPTASIFGRVVDAATRLPRDAEIRYRRAGSPETRVIQATDLGEFALHDVEPGVYTILARTRDGRFGSATGVELRAGDTAENLVLTLTPGGRVRVLRSSDEPAFCVLTAREIPFTDGEIASWKSFERAAPAGRVTLLTGARERHVTVVAGKTVEVVIGE